MSFSITVTAVSLDELATATRTLANRLNLTNPADVPGAAPVAPKAVAGGAAKTAAPKTAAPKAAPAPVAPEAPAAGRSKAECSAIITEVVKRLGRDAAVALCTKYGAPNVGALDPKTYDGLFADATAALAAESVAS